MDFYTVALYLNYLVQIIFILLGAYFFTISLFSFIPRRVIDSKKSDDDLHSFALVVAAHNEEIVIGNMVKSLKFLDYPSDKFDIFVIADNCTDKTAHIAREVGAIVYERFVTDKDKKGKGHALEWMFEKLYDLDNKYDYVAIFDADNVVHKNFLREMNEETKRGSLAVQGYIDSKNPNDSWVTYSYSLAFWVINQLFQKSRYNLRLGCQLCGTGFVVQMDLLKKIGWQATCLTEDMEFTMRLAMNDIKVSYASGAIVYDEKPITFQQSWEQRKRWMQGHADVASRFVVPLVKKAFKERNLVPLDCALYLLQPVRIITMGMITFMAWLQSAYPDLNLVVWGLVPANIWNVVVIFQMLWTPAILIMENRLCKNFLLRYFAYMVYCISWVPIAFIGIINKNEKEWFHTKHTREISIEEVG